MTDFDFNTSTPSNNVVPSDNIVSDGVQSGNAGYGNAIADGNPGNFRTPNPQADPETFGGPAAKAAPSPKLGGKAIAIIAGLSLVCGLIGGVGGAFAMSAISGSGQQRTSQQGPGGQSNGQMGGPGGQSGSGSGQSNGQMGEPPSGQPGHGGSDSGQSGQSGSGQSGSGQSGQQGGSGSGSSDSGSSGSNNSSSYLDFGDSGSIAS